MERDIELSKEQIRLENEQIILIDKDTELVKQQWNYGKNDKV